ncbi:gag-pol polyprotein [Cucumis melo var. makuwa]|uniref:Gag-pol polyprotein n=1 Tax=Cucumis melo var. makuwa TaxID=1194695 RepID=A0A5A7ULR3_CUCMM|nr:gag-pol polyprotein [Cucumis melo var. makuwa]TYJ95732.1 gag-pol polyprotein [Cucumis melo var. makuwa]
MKVTAIEEANDITTMKLDELFGLLRTFELSFEDQAVALLSRCFTKFKNKFYKNTEGYGSHRLTEMVPVQTLPARARQTWINFN